MERTMGVTADARRSMRIRYVAVPSSGWDDDATSLEEYRDLCTPAGTSGEFLVS